ncbi:P22AR C-terminal domain-containing protein [Aggregatibacter actinomycetemcomitans]|uniref:P22AR C-terminal domain-containing protein n=1 Tax=Aggregatibacter actinomycetemcomitans TaxID=714 RepID=UPI0021518F89|nr:P22AR C-terminal domain-containing protein [Aggregatibacter actinomycetemcomitans]
MTTLTFQTTTLSVINQHNQTYFTSSELGKGLGYANPLQSVTNLYNSNADEFTAEMTALIDMPTAGGLQKVRIFSLRGAHLIAMFARTKVAKDFRRWVLDILDREAKRQQPTLPAPKPKTYTIEMTENDITVLLWLWFIAVRVIGSLKILVKPLKLLQAPIAPEVVSQAHEYPFTVEHARRILLKMSKDLEAEPWRDDNLSRVLPKIRNFNESDLAYPGDHRNI